MKIKQTENEHYHDRHAGHQNRLNKTNRLINGYDKKGIKQHKCEHNYDGHNGYEHRLTE